MDPKSSPTEPNQADLLELYGRASAWANEKVAGSTFQLDARTPCDRWDVRTLMDHMLDTQRYFLGSARGEDAPLPAAEPPRMVGDDPVADFRRTRADMLAAFGEEGVIDKTGPALGIAFADQLIHGWDLARATGQEARMPEGLAEVAYGMIHGRFTDEQRKGRFGPELPVGADASPQDRLLAYTGRDPR
jgi:uncharacterized protein (TIGR03086 family)